MFFKALSAYLGGHDEDRLFASPRQEDSQNTAKTALLATAALAMPYAVTPSPLTVVCTAATAMVQNRAFHDFRAVECGWRKLYPRIYLAELLYAIRTGLLLSFAFDLVSPATSWERGARRER